MGGGPPGPRPIPRSASSSRDQRDQGIARGPGGPPPISRHKMILMLNRYLFAALALAIPAAAQRFTSADYARAEKFMGYNTNPLVYHGAATPTWLQDGRFWYRTTTADGTEFILVDP